MGFEGVEQVYPGLAPFSQWRCDGSCVCTKPRFDVDGFGRLSYGRYHQRQFEGGLGGPLDADPSPGLGNLNLQVWGNTDSHVKIHGNAKC